MLTNEKSQIETELATQKQVSQALRAENEVLRLAITA